MTREELIREIKQDKTIVKRRVLKRYSFEVEINGKKYFVPQEWIEDDIGDDFVKKLIGELKRK